DELPLPPLLAISDAGHNERAEQDRAFLRARLALGLFKLGGIDAAHLEELDRHLDEAMRDRDTPGAIATLGQHIRRTWSEQLLAHFEREDSPRGRDRIAWIAPPFDAYEVLVSIRPAARQEILESQAHALWYWLSEQYHYQSHDTPGAGPFF